MAEGLEDLKVKTNDEYSITAALKESSSTMTLTDIMKLLSQLIKSAQIFKRWTSNLDEMTTETE